MESPKTITRMVLSLMLQAGLAVLSVSIVALDTELYAQGRSEYSLTEFTQEAAILISALLFGFSAKYDAQARGFYVLVAGLFATMLIRESDALFDRIQHGFWLYPALAVSLFAIVYARKCAGTVKKPMLESMDSKNFAYITLGLIIILVFSRTFGSGNLLRGVMGSDYSSVYKSVLQEGIELFGYLFVLYGSVLVWIKSINSRRKSQGSHV